MNVGIIGGGQLAMMLTEAAIPLGHHVYVLDPNPHASAKYVGATLLNYAYDDPKGLSELSIVSDVICYEFENIDTQVLHAIKHKLPQGIDALEISRDRMLEKTFAKSLGIPIPFFISIESKDDFEKAFYPSILKTTRFGYDGKGQHIINQYENLVNIDIHQPMILEERINFDKEVSVILTRDSYGDIAYYPLVENHHNQGILHSSIPWWDAPQYLKEEAYGYARTIIEKLNYIGTLAIEFFIVDHHVVFNEMAPRPHNSGHFSIEGTTVSQFKNMMLAITHEHIEIPNMTKPSMMINILGQHRYDVSLIKDKNIYVHDYFKHSQQHNRKIGHITILGSNFDELKQIEKHLKVT